MSENPKPPTSGKENKPNLRNHDGVGGTTNLGNHGNPAIFVKGPARQAQVEDLPSDLHEMFVAYDAVYFDTVLVRNGVSVRWSGKTMTSCAGLCKRGTNGAIEIVISEPLHKFRTSTELKETLLHEMIHALDFLRPGAKFDHDGHGEFFRSEMKRINGISERNTLDPYRPGSGYHITIFHNFTAEVDFHRKHQWQCARCGMLIKRPMNRPPSEKDCRHYRVDGSKWKHDGSPENARIRNRCGDNSCMTHNHIRTCGGDFAKTAGPEMEAPKAADKGKGAVRSKIQAGPSGIKRDDRLDHNKPEGIHAPIKDLFQTQIQARSSSSLLVETPKKPTAEPESNPAPCGASCTLTESNGNPVHADEIAAEIAQRNNLMKELTQARQRRASQGTANSIATHGPHDRIHDMQETPRSPSQPEAKDALADPKKQSKLPTCARISGTSFYNGDIQVVSVTSKDGSVVVFDNTTPAITNIRARKKQRVSGYGQAIVIGGPQEVVDVDGPTAMQN